MPADASARKSIEDDRQINELALQPDVWVSRPGESHPWPLAEPDVNLSAHPAPIIQPQEISLAANAQRDLGSLGLLG